MCVRARVPVPSWRAVLTGVCVRSVNDLLSLLSGFGGDGTGLYSLSSHPLCACVLGERVGGGLPDAGPGRCVQMAPTSTATDASTSTTSSSCSHLSVPDPSLPLSRAHSLALSHRHAHALCVCVPCRRHLRARGGLRARPRMWRSGLDRLRECLPTHVWCRDVCTPLLSRPTALPPAPPLSP